MKRTLLRRLKQLELRKHANPPLVFRFGLLRRLPDEYRGERHVVTVSRESTNSPPSELCEFEERPGPASPVSLRARVRALERKQAKAAGSVRPPVEFFDAILAGTASRQEWDRWAPWLHQNILHPPNSLLADSETDAGSEKVNAQVIKR
jgi:hypothetical protein